MAKRQKLPHHQPSKKKKTCQHASKPAKQMRLNNVVLNLSIDHEEWRMEDQQHYN